MMRTTMAFKLKPKLVGAVRRSDRMISTIMPDGSKKYLTDDEFREVLTQREKLEREAKKNGDSAIKH